MKKRKLIKPIQLTLLKQFKRTLKGTVVRWTCDDPLVDIQPGEPYRHDTTVTYPARQRLYLKQYDDVARNIVLDVAHRWQFCIRMHCAKGDVKYAHEVEFLTTNEHHVKQLDDVMCSHVEAMIEQADLDDYEFFEFVATIT